MRVEITTVAPDLVVTHRRPATDEVTGAVSVQRYEGLVPDTDYEFGGVMVRTLPRPGGELLCRIATVNDVHFGETECGRIDDHRDGPIQRPRPGEPPHPETMNRAAAAEIAAIDPAALVVKGDLSQDGQPEEWAAFEDCYRPPFGDRLHVVRGNHDAYRGQSGYEGDRWIEFAGLAIALMDTTIPGATTGTLSIPQLEWLADHASVADRPVLVMGHHQQWIGHPGARRADDYFGMHPDPSDGLDVVAQRCPRILGYTAGHTHRHRGRRMVRSGVVSVEIGCTKDFPGTWAEYQVYEAGVIQVVHRISAPDALDWSERCRHLYADFGVDYESYALGSLADRCFVLPASR